MKKTIVILSVFLLCMGCSIVPGKYYMVRPDGSLSEMWHIEVIDTGSGVVFKEVHFEETYTFEIEKYSPWMIFEKLYTLQKRKSSDGELLEEINIKYRRGELVGTYWGVWVDELSDISFKRKGQIN